ncbi:SIMPL domain-containing protein [bacterium]
MFKNVREALILGGSFLLGAILTGLLFSTTAINFKEYERTVVAKGLSEKEVPADIAIWPIQFTVTGNDLNTIYQTLEQNTNKILNFLTSNGFDRSELSYSSPSITDKLANQYQESKVELRFVAGQSITVYTNKVDLVRSVKTKIVKLGREGIMFGGSNYNHQNTEYLFTKLNDIKPSMIEEATRKAREVAEKFATDSNSKLGKIKSARQGQFSIQNRDQNTPYIKKVRVVSTVEYYLSD